MEPVRHELKLASREASYARVRAALTLDPLAIRVLHPSRWVQSLYLDTYAGRALEENLAGISHREKLRFRWYGVETERVRGRLECKVRENALGWKEVVGVDADLEVEGARASTFVTGLRGALPMDWRARLDGLRPVQWVRYLRDYLSTRDGRVRITLDRELATFDQRPRARLSSRPRGPRQRILVVELKCAPENVEVAQAIVARLPIPVDRCSKFVLASEASHGPNPSLNED